VAPSGLEIQGVSAVSAQLASHRSTNGQVIEGRHSVHRHPAYKRGVTGSNPVAPTRSEGMLGGPVGSRRAKRRAVPLPGQARWLLLRRHQDVPATAGSEASRHISGRAARAGAAQAADHLKVGSCGKAAAGCSPRRSAPCSNSTTSDAASGRSPERSACATSEFPGAAAYVREH